MHRAADLFVQPFVIFRYDLLIRIPRLVLDVLFVEVVPEAVVYTVEANVDKVKIVPFLLLQQPVDHLPLFPAHLENLLLQPVLVVRAKSLDVHGVLRNEFRDPGLESSGVGEFVFAGVRGHEAADANALEAARGIAGRHTHYDRLLALASQIIPQSRFLNRSRIDEAQPAIRVVGAVTKAAAAQRARILTGRHTHPCRHGDGRDRSEEHTSELQSLAYLVCRLLLEKKKTTN